MENAANPRIPKHMHGQGTPTITRRESILWRARETKKRERGQERERRESLQVRDWEREREKRRGEGGRWRPLDRGRKSEEGNRDERKRRKREMGDILERE